MTDLKSARSSGGRRGRGGRDEANRTPLPSGQRVYDTVFDREGTILDHACQYAHPQAPPMFTYLIRWQDGQVQALAEAAFRPGQGLDLID